MSRGNDGEQEQMAAVAVAAKTAMKPHNRPRRAIVTRR
jgi:hypothetical protein